MVRAQLIVGAHATKDLREAARGAAGAEDGPRRLAVGLHLQLTPQGLALECLRVLLP